MSIALAGASVLSGCNVDSFIDPSQTGRFEYTPTTVPILDRVASIEDQPVELVQKSRIQPSDLVPEVEEYRFAAADQLEIHIRDFFFIGQEDVFPVTVDLRGFIELPKLGSIRAQGRNRLELTTAIEQAIRSAQINDNPLVSVITLSQRKQTFSVIGAVQTPGSYYVPAADYRLLEGITAAGGLDETVRYLYVIRQVPLTDETSYEPDRPVRAPQGEGWNAPQREGTNNNTNPKSGENIIDLIDELSGDKGSQTPAPAPAPAPQGTSPQGQAPIDLPGSKPSPGVMRSAAARRQPAPIDLPNQGMPQTRPAERAPEPMSRPATGASDFIYENGRWVRRTESMAQAETQGVLTQRVIEVPVDRLLAGAAEVNIIIRPGDVIRVPGNRSGLVYVAGQVNRPGPYNLPTDGSRLTLTRALDAAGGLSNLAIPERMELTRMVGQDRQATIRINGRAIAEQTQPDIYMKADDRLNVGTNFWALPLAIIRNGFRASYGFGFILDRNFGNDVFGAPPENNGN